jgi:hypothetical protein
MPAIADCFYLTTLLAMFGDGVKSSVCCRNARQFTLQHGTARACPRPIPNTHLYGVNHTSHWGCNLEDCQLCKNNALKVRLGGNCRADSGR